MIQDPATSVKHYQEHYGLRLVDVYHLPALGRSNYYLASLRQGDEDWPEPGTMEVTPLRVQCCKLVTESRVGSHDTTNREIYDVAVPTFSILNSESFQSHEQSELSKDDVDADFPF